MSQLLESKKTERLGDFSPMTDQRHSLLEQMIAEKEAEASAKVPVETIGLSTQRRSLLEQVIAEKEGLKQKEVGRLKGIASDIASGIPALGELTGHAIKTFDPEGGIDIGDRVGQGIIDVSKKMAKIGIMRPREPEGFVKRGISGGLQSTVPSLAPMLGGTAVGAALGIPLGPPGILIGGLLGGTAATLGIHGLGVYGQKKEEYIQQGKDEKTAHSAAVKQGLINGGIEVVSNIIGMLTFGWGKLAAQPLKQTAKELLSTPVEMFAKNLTKNAFLNEVPTEIVQGALGAKVEESIGLLPEGEWQKAAVEAIIPALTMSVLFGVGAQGATSLQRGQIKKQLNSADPQKRVKAVEYIAKNIDDKGLRQVWVDNTTRLINKDAPIDINADFTQATTEEITSLVAPSKDQQIELERQWAEQEAEQVRKETPEGRQEQLEAEWGEAFPEMPIPMTTVAEETTALATPMRALGMRAKTALSKNRQRELERLWAEQEAEQVRQEEAYKEAPEGRQEQLEAEWAEQEAEQVRQEEAEVFGVTEPVVPEVKPKLKKYPITKTQIKDETGETKAWFTFPQPKGRGFKEGEGYLYETLEDAENSRKEQLQEDETQKKWEERDAKEKKEADERLAKERDLDGFADDFSTLQRGRIVKTLNKRGTYNKALITLKEFIRNEVAEGKVVNKAGNIIGKLDEHGNVIGTTIGKTGGNYANYLISKKEVAGISGKEQVEAEQRTPGIQEVLQTPVKLSTKESIKTKEQAKKTLRTALETGEIAVDAPVRFTTVDELRAILKKDKLFVGEDFEGVPGISAQRIAEDRMVAYGDNTKTSVAIIFPEGAIEGIGTQPNEVMINPVTKIDDLKFVIGNHGKIISSTELKELYPGRAKIEPKISPKTQVGQEPIENLNIDASRFQYKRFLGGKGAGSKLNAIKKYSPELGGIVSVWRDTSDNKLYIVNGHHRYELAKRTGEKELTVRRLKAKNAEEARLKGALINIAEGQGSPEDAALIFRQNGITPEVIGDEYGVSLKGKVAQEGMALAGLADGIFHQVEIGGFPRKWGIVIGEKLRNDFDAQIELTKLLKREGKKKNITPGIIEQIINDLQNVGKTTETQATLFGDEIRTRPLLIERAELKDYALNKLLSDKRLFGSVSGEAKASRLEKAGNIISAKENKRLSEEAGVLISVFNRLASHEGPINETINKYAKELADATDAKQRNATKQAFFEELQNSIQQELPGIQKGFSERIERDGKRGEPSAGKQLAWLGLRMPDKAKSFSTKETKPTSPQDTITRKDLSEIFSKMKGISTGLNKKGNFYFKMKDRHAIEILEVDHIEGYINTSGGRIPVGSFLKNKIELKTSGAGPTADTGTAFHELTHWMEKNHVISNNDIKALNKEIAKGKNMLEHNVTEEDRASYVGDRLSAWKAQENHRIKQVLKKIADFMNAIYELAAKTKAGQRLGMDARTARGVLGDISTGKVLEKGKKGPLNAAEKMLGMKKITEKIKAKPFSAMDIAPAVSEKEGIKKWKDLYETKVYPKLRGKWDSTLKAVSQAMPEAVREGLSEKVISTEVKEASRAASKKVNAIAQEGISHINNIKENVPESEHKLLYQVLDGRAEPGKLASVSEPIRKDIMAWGKRLVDAKVLPQQVYEKGLGTYLHRTIAKYETQNPFKAFLYRKFKLEEGQFKHRGVPPKQVKNEEVAAWLEGNKDGETWEILKEGGEKTTIWRDWSERERESHGEIMNAVHAVARTFEAMAKSVGYGEFFSELSENVNVTKAEWAPGLVQVPNTRITKGGTYKFGKLHGKYITKNDYDYILSIVNPADPVFWKPLITFFKKNKTYRNPGTHVNNTLQNIMWADFQDVPWKTIMRATKEYKTSGEWFKEAEALDVFGHDIVTQELRDSVSMPVKEEGLASNIVSHLKNVDEKAKAAYQAEDGVFRLAYFMDRVQKGVSKNVAAEGAIKAFIDYEITAPWVVTLRDTGVVPFISWPYKALPLMIDNIMRKPWKVAKWSTIFYTFNLLSQAISGGDEEKERRLLPEHMKGWSPYGPTAIKIPFKSAGGHSIYADISRKIPFGDVFNFTSTQVGPFGFGGPIFMPFEIWLNKQAYSGRDIVTKNVDNVAEQIGKYAQFVWKGVMPNIPGLPFSYATSNIIAAAKSREDWLGRDQSVFAATIGGVGLKGTAINVKKRLYWKQKEFDKDIRALKSKIASAKFRPTATSASIEKTEDKYNRRIIARTIDWLAFLQDISSRQPISAIPEKTKANFVDGELMKLEQPSEAEIKRGIKPLFLSPPSRYLTIRNKKIELTQIQYDKYVEDSADNARLRLEKIIKNPLWKKATRVQKENVVRRVVKESRASTKEKLKRQLSGGKAVSGKAPLKPKKRKLDWQKPTGFGEKPAWK